MKLKSLSNSCKLCTRFFCSATDSWIFLDVLPVAVAFCLYGSTTGLVPCSATPTTFGDLRAANGQGQQRRRITSVQPPSGLQEWLKMFQVTTLAEINIWSSSASMVYVRECFRRVGTPYKSQNVSAVEFLFSCNNKWPSTLRNICSLFQQVTAEVDKK